jgi:serine/threonine-protein kinase
MPDLTNGTEIAERYRVVSRLGSGGMADVYLADDLQLGRQVAVKLLHRRFASDPDFVERFRREAQAAAGLQHPNIVSVYDRGEWDGIAYISMEYLAGQTLKDLIRQEAPIEPSRAVSIASQIAHGARFAHRGGVIHRDLKPQNVMIGEEDRAVVTDFGIARAGASGVTEVGSVMGSAHYVSPEQAQGAEVSATSDVYSVGVVLYEMLTGKVPFDADSPVAIAMKHVTEQPQPPSDLAPGIPADLDAVVLWALRKTPADRPQSADELIRALDAIGERLRLGEDNSATVAFSVPVAPAATIGAVAQLPPIRKLAEPVAQTRPDDEQSENASSGSSKRKWWATAGIAALLIVGIAGFLLTRSDMVTMPLVVGKDLQTATTIIANAGFTGSPDIQRVQNTRPRDEVIRQEPLAGDSVATDRKVVLVVSDGPGAASVPAVTDLSEKEARSVLEKSGFKVQARSKSDPTVKQGFVIATDPIAGTNLQRGSVVAILVSTGVEQVSVPDVTGQNVDDARSLLAAAGFVVTTAKKTSKTDADGTVLSQSPIAGGTAPRGSTVALVVAAKDAAPTTATIPTVIGLLKADAQSKINAASLNASFITVTASGSPGCDISLDGKVIDQDPAGGGMASKGTTVKVTVCFAPRPITTTTPVPE